MKLYVMKWDNVLEGHHEHWTGSESEAIRWRHTNFEQNKKPAIIVVEVPTIKIKLIAWLNERGGT